MRATQRLVHDDVLALRELTGLQYAVESGAADPAAALDAIADDVRRTARRSRWSSVSCPRCRRSTAPH